MVLKPLGCNPEGNDSLISFFFMFCCSVNAWGCFHHNWKIFIFMSYFWAKIWSITFGHIWEVLDCLISFLCFFIEWVNPWWCFLNFFISREFLGPAHQKSGLKPSGRTSEGSISFDFSNSCQKSSSKIQLKHCFDFIWFFWKHKLKIEFD